MYYAQVRGGNIPRCICRRQLSTNVKAGSKKWYLDKTHTEVGSVHADAANTPHQDNLMDLQSLKAAV